MDVLQAELCRERALWGPELPSTLDTWQLDSNEGLHRMRRRLRANPTFYATYPVRARHLPADSNSRAGRGTSGGCADGSGAWTISPALSSTSPQPNAKRKNMPTSFNSLPYYRAYVQPILRRLLRAVRHHNQRQQQEVQSVGGSGTGTGSGDSALPLLVLESLLAEATAATLGFATAGGTQAHDGNRNSSRRSGNGGNSALRLVDEIVRCLQARKRLPVHISFEVQRLLLVALAQRVSASQATMSSTAFALLNWRTAGSLLTHQLALMYPDGTDDGDDDDDDDEEEEEEGVGEDRNNAGAVAMVDVGDEAKEVVVTTSDEFDAVEVSLAPRKAVLSEAADEHSNSSSSGSSSSDSNDKQEQQPSIAVNDNFDSRTLPATHTPAAAVAAQNCEK